MKFMLYAHLAVSLFSSLLIFKWWQKSWLTRPFIILIVLLWTFAGVLTVYREQTLSWEIASPKVVELGQVLRTITPPESNFLTSDAHNHPVTMLAGRKTVMGYRGWLWTHGINYAQTEADVLTMMAGENNTSQLLEKYQVDFVFIGPQELEDYHANQEYFNENYHLIYEDGENSIYSIE